MMHKRNDAYGHCPKCRHLGWHRYKGKAIIFGDGQNKYKVSLFKCPQCGKKFGFDLSGDIMKPKNNDKEWEDEFTITPDEAHEIVDRLGEMVKAIDHDYIDPNAAAVVLHNVAGINRIIKKVTNC